MKDLHKYLELFVVKNEVVSEDKHKPALQVLHIYLNMHGFLFMHEFALRFGGPCYGI